MDLSREITLNPSSGVPLYRQVADRITSLIENGIVHQGERLPPTRKLAGQLGLNRTTISAAYALLEENGLIRGHVGRGSFVSARSHSSNTTHSQFDWESLVPRPEYGSAANHHIEISFANSRPAEDLFPLAVFRRLAKEVIDGPEAAEILQLGAPHGYARLRRYLLEEAARQGVARPGDDLLITNGCQQALDLIARVLTPRGEAVVLEDPTYHGLRRVFERTGAELIGLPTGENGADLDILEQALIRQRPKVVVLTPSFQNPTGSSFSLQARQRVVELVRRYGVVLVENDIYSELRYQGSALPSLKQLDETGNTILLRSYSKVSFPGLRVGWVIAPRPLIAGLADAKQSCDLHSDHLSQAVLLRFAQSGELAKHLERVRKAGEQRLQAVLRACRAYLPAGSRFTRPEGGMNLWVDLPPPIDAGMLLEKAQAHGVDFVPGKYFAIQRRAAGSLRLSFAGLSPEQIQQGLHIIGDLARQEAAANVVNEFLEPASALV